MSLQTAFHAAGYRGHGAACPDESPAASRPAAHGQVAVAEVLDDAHQAIAARMACRQLRFHVVNKAGAARVIGCRRSLAGALVSLLENALAACLQGDYVELTAAEDAGAIRIAVRDTGCGIPRELQARLFETSFDASRGGKGLGLALVRSVAEAHGGAITASSAPGRGSEFALYLQSADGEASRQAADIEHQQGTGH